MLPFDEFNDPRVSTSPLMNNAKQLLGEIIRETCSLQQEVINQALMLQRRNGFRLGEILILQNIISEPDLHQALAIQTAGIDNSNSVRPDTRNGVSNEKWVDGTTWFKLVGLSVLMGGTATLGIWFLSGLLVTLFAVFD